MAALAFTSFPAMSSHAWLQEGLASKQMIRRCNTGSTRGDSASPSASTEPSPSSQRQWMSDDDLRSALDQSLTAGGSTDPYHTMRSLWVSDDALRSALDRSLTTAASEEPAQSSGSQWSLDDVLRSKLDQSLSAAAAEANVRGEQLPTLLTAKYSTAAQGQVRPPSLFQKRLSGDSLFEDGVWNPADNAFSAESAAASGSEDETQTPSVPSLGSALHASGACRPCSSFLKSGSCFNGSKCYHCHLCPLGTLLRGKKEKTEGFKQSARERFHAQGTPSSAARTSTAQPRHGAHTMAAPGPFSLLQVPYALPGQLSLGSARHARGRCKPCGYFWRLEGCPWGSQCTHCHLCPPGEREAGQMAAAAFQEQSRLMSMSCLVEEDEEETGVLTVAEASQAHELPGASRPAEEDEAVALVQRIVAAASRAQELPGMSCAAEGDEEKPLVAHVGEGSSDEGDLQAFRPLSTEVLSF